MDRFGVKLVVTVQEKKNIRPTFSVEHIYGGTLLAMCSNDFVCFYDWVDCRLIRRIDVNVKVSTNTTWNNITVKLLILARPIVILCFPLVYLIVLECLLG